MSLPRLFHYTKTSSLLGILDSQELYFSCLRNLNDASEGRAILDIIRDLVPTGIAKNLIQYVKKNFSSIEKKARSSYSFSFTTEEDDASQWDRYADQGKGVCIEFNSEQLERLMNSFSQVRLNKIIYIDSNREKEIENELNKLASNIIIDDLIKELAFFSMRFKHFSFRHENEYRLSYIRRNTELDEHYPSYDPDISEEQFSREMEEEISRIESLHELKAGPFDLSNSFKRRMRLDLNKVAIHTNSIIIKEFGIPTFFKTIVIGPKWTQTVFEDFCDYIRQKYKLETSSIKISKASCTLI